MTGRRRTLRAAIASAAAAGAALAAVIVALVAGHATVTPPRPPSGGPWAAPYYYLGAAGLPPPAQIMTAGVRRFTLAFIQSDGRCGPAWDGQDPLAGGSEQDVIRSIRSAGGDVAVSFGGMGGAKLGVACPSPAALAATYQQVISAYRLRAIDLDVEDAETGDAAVRQRIISALMIVRRSDPGLVISITISADPAGPDASGRDLIVRAATAGLRVNAWTIMPFDFASPVASMGNASVQAAEALKDDLMSAYREPASAAYAAMGISSMNGRTDTGEIVRVADFQIMLRYVQAHHLARFTFWSANRDRSCSPGGTADSCSGIAEAPYAFSAIIAQYRG